MQRVCKVFPPKTGGGPVHAKRGASRSMQQRGLVHAKPRSLTCADFEYVFTIPTSAYILPLLLPSPVSPPVYYSASVHVSVQQLGLPQETILLHAYAHSSYVHVPMHVQIYTTMLHACIHVQRIYATLQQFPYLGSRYLEYEQGDIY